jgi:hypothetical protein
MDSQVSFVSWHSLSATISTSLQRQGTPRFVGRYATRREDVWTVFDPNEKISDREISFYLSITSSSWYARIISNNDPWDYLILEQTAWRCCCGR